MSHLAKLIATALLAFMLLAGVGMYFGYRVVVESKDQSTANHALLRVLLGVSGCTIDDTAERCHQRQLDRSDVEGVKRIADVECRIRRALDGLPSETLCVPR